MQATPIGGTSMNSVLAERFPDLVTIMAPTATTNDCNEPVVTWSALAGHSNIPAMVAPGDVYAKLKRQEILSPQGTTEMAYRRVMLNGYYPLIRSTHRVQIDGTLWDIVAIDIDPTATFTELSAQLVNPRSN